MAFRACAKQHRRPDTRYFTKISSHSKDDSARSRGSPTQTSWPYNGALTTPPKNTTKSAQQQDGSKGQGQETDLFPQKEEQTAVDTERRVPVPLRAIPKAQLTPNLRLSPRERLHIEVLTRQQPKLKTEKKMYRERLQIYHMGNFKENMLAILKMSTIVSACGVTFIIAPAHLSAGHDLWLVVLIWLAGFVPMGVVNYLTKPMVSRIFLNLPAKARETSKAAMEYAKNLPPDADLDIRYLKPWALEKSIKARISEFEPTKGNFLRPLTFKWRDKFNSRRASRFTPTSFFVWPKTASGASSKDTIPGIWESVYKQLMKPAERTGVAKWEKPGSGLSLR